MRAAEGGHVLAQYNLGILYLNGIGVTADPSQAQYWIEQAANKGHSKAAEMKSYLAERNKAVS